MILDAKILKRCVDAGMCEQGIMLWKDVERLIPFAKKEIDFLLKTRVLSHKEIIDLFGLDYLNKRDIFIDQAIEDKAFKQEKYLDIRTVFLGCKGNVRLYTTNNVFIIGDNSEMSVRVFGEGVLTIRLYSGSVLDLSVKRNAQVMIFNYGGIVRKIHNDKGFVKIENITL